MIKPGFSVTVESGAGEGSYYSDADYVKAGATISADSSSLYAKSDILLKVRPPTPEEAREVTKDKTLISFLYPAQNKELLDQLEGQGATAFAMDCIPRTLSRGQTYDALSSQANIAG